MLTLALKNLTRRRLRTALTLFGVAISVGVLACLLAFGKGYEAGLGRELNNMGIQMMLVPLGCPYDAAARVLKGKTLDVSLPAESVKTVRREVEVEIAAPMLMATLPRPSEGRTDLWVGVDESIRPLKPWWKMKEGSHWFPDENSVILGAEAANVEIRQVGDTFFSPETGRKFTVCGVLERSGTSDDSQFFVPLATAQTMFRQPDRITAVAIRLKDPTRIGDVSKRLQEVRGAQVVTMAEMMGTFLNLIGSVRTLVLAIAIVALCISGLSVFNTMLSAVLERTRELGVLRAVGASRSQVFSLLTVEAVLLTTFGSAIGVILALLLGHFVELIVRFFVQIAPSEAFLILSREVIQECFMVGIVVGLGAGLYPAWQASRLQPVDAIRID